MNVHYDHHTNEETSQMAENRDGTSTGTHDWQTCAWENRK